LQTIYSAEAFYIPHCCGASQRSASVVSECSRKSVTGNKLSSFQIPQFILRQTAQNIHYIEKVTINTVQLNIDLGYEMEQVEKCL